MAKTKDLYLRFVPRIGEVPECYEVKRLTNSTDYNPNAVMSRREVNELCKRRDWKVHIT